MKKYKRKGKDFQEGKKLSKKYLKNKFTIYKLKLKVKNKKTNKNQQEKLECHKNKKQTTYNK